MSIINYTSEPEQAVLSACITSRDSIRFAKQILEPEDFYHPHAGDLFRLLLDMETAGTPISAASVAAESAKRKINLTAADVADLLRAIGNSGSVNYFAQIVRDDSARRQLTAVVTRAQQALADPSAEVSTIIQDVISGSRDVREGSTDQDSFRAKTLQEIMEIEDVYEWVIPGLLEKRDRVIITAGEGAGKTTLVRQISIAAAAGVHPFHLTPIEPVRVLVVDSENSERQWRRALGKFFMRAVNSTKGASDPMQHVRIACIPRTSITRDKELGKIHRMIDGFDPELVCIGPLYRLGPGAMNTDEEASPVLAALDTIRDTGAAMVIEAHAGKGTSGATSERDLRPRGSSALLGWPEFGFGISLPDSKGVSAIQRWRGDREERHWPQLITRGTTWPWVDAMTAGLTRWEAAS